MELCVKRIFAMLCLGLGLWAAPARSETVLSDDEFLESLSYGGADLPVDRERLAILFFNVSKVLQAETDQLGNMQQLVRVPSALRENTLQVMAMRFDEYAASVSRFAGHAEELRKEPRSTLRLYHTLREGQRTCWMLDLYTQLVGSWSGGGSELRAILPSRAACGRFRTAAFVPRVEGLIGDALVEQVFQREEIRRLTEELQEAQALLEELTRIDSTE